jgi:hypothetical protein
MAKGQLLVVPIYWFKHKNIILNYIRMILPIFILLLLLLFLFLVRYQSTEVNEIKPVQSKVEKPLDTTAPAISPEEGQFESTIVSKSGTPKKMEPVKLQTTPQSQSKLLDVLLTVYGNCPAPK